MFPEVESIALRRKSLGLTQAELAKLAGLSQSYIAKLEANKIEPSYSKVKSIFESLQRLERRMEIRALEIMTKDVVSVQVFDPVKKAVRLMRNRGYSQLPVFDREIPVGSISERTVIDKILENEDDEPIEKKLVSSIMDENCFPTVSEETPISLLSSLLRQYPAILVSKKGKIIGIITKADLLRTLG